MHDPSIIPGREANAEHRDWPGYYDAVQGRAPRDTLLRAIEAFDREGLPAGDRLALDLGCGEGRDTLELLIRGWRVVAIDPCRDGIDRLLSRVEEDHRSRLDVRLEQVEDADLPMAPLVNVSFSIPFFDPTRFDEFWPRLVRAVAPGGRFAGQFFGDRDDWASIPGRLHHTREQVDRLLAPFHVEQLDEIERDGKDAFANPKHWHVYHVVARKRPDPVP
jgi:SAM-dependent methyltransferase